MSQPTKLEFYLLDSSLTITDTICLPKSNILDMDSICKQILSDDFLEENKYKPKNILNRVFEFELLHYPHIEKISFISDTSLLIQCFSQQKNDNNSSLKLSLCGERDIYIYYCKNKTFATINYSKSLLSDKTLEISPRWLAVRNDANFNVFGSGRAWYNCVRLRNTYMKSSKNTLISAAKPIVIIRIPAIRLIQNKCLKRIRFFNTLKSRVKANHQLIVPTVTPIRRTTIESTGVSCLIIPNPAKLAAKINKLAGFVNVIKYISPIIVIRFLYVCPRKTFRFDFIGSVSISFIPTSINTEAPISVKIN